MGFRHPPAVRRAWLRDALLAAALVAPACMADRSVGGVDTPALADRVDLSPKIVTLSPSNVADFQAIAFTASGDTARGTMTWSVTGGTLIDTSSSGGRHYGRFLAGSDTGSFDLIARERLGNSADTAIITVTLVAVARVLVVPSVVSVALRASEQLSATIRDSTGATLSGRVVAWSTTNPSVVTVNGSGLVTGVGLGTATITSASEGKRGAAMVFVSGLTPAPPTQFPRNGHPSANRPAHGP